jgi:hypothetical protein
MIWFDSRKARVESLAFDPTTKILAVAFDYQVSLIKRTSLSESFVTICHHVLCQFQRPNGISQLLLQTSKFYQTHLQCVKVDKFPHQVHVPCTF